jgi:hypothetical protein
MSKNIRCIVRLLIISLCVPAISGICIAQPKFFPVGGTEFSFGDIPQSAPVTHILTIKNKGKDTLILSDISASCGCTGTLMSNDHIAPRDSGMLSVTFSPKSYNGKVEKTVNLRTNDTAHASVTIHFTANVVQVLAIDPEYIFFKTVIDSSTVQTITIKNLSPHPVQFLSVRSSASFITVKLPRESLDPGEETTLTGIITPKTSGAVGGSIEIKTDNPLLPVLNIRVFVWVRASTTETTH